MEQALKNKDQVKGNIFSRVKGGFSVDLNDAIAFLPGSQVDVKVIKDNSYLLGTNQIFHILKMDRKRGNIVVSRRSVLEEESRGKERNGIYPGRRTSDGRHS